MARKMKDSGIEWIGKIPENWDTIKVKYTSWLKGRIGWDGLKSTEYTDVGAYLITGVNFNKGVIDWDSCVHITEDRFHEDSDIHIKEDDLLITKDGTIGKVAIAKNCPEMVSLNSGVLLIRNIYDFKYHDKYMYYVLLSDVFWRWYTLSQTGQSTIKHLYQEQFYNFEFTFPPLSEQQLISSYLDHQCGLIDSIIEKTKSTIEEYKKLKQSVIIEAVTKGIRPNREMKNSGIEWIGEIPKEWKINSIKNIAITCSGGTPSSGDESLYDGNINWVCSYDLNEKPIYESGRKITQKGADSIAGKLQNVGSILIAMYGGSGTIGNSGILECEARTNQAICSVKFNNDYIMDYYGFYYILAIRQYWMIYAVGTRKDPNISQDIVKRMPCVIPTLNEQTEIIKYLNEKCLEIDILIAKKEQIVSELESYKKSLIYEYVTGKKEVV